MADSALTVHFDTREFDRALTKYADLTKKVPAEIVNRKAYFINRRAIWHTPKADRAGIIRELEGSATTNLVLIKSGKRYSRAKKNRTYVFNRTSSGAASRWERIFVGRLKKSGKAIPSGQALADAMLRGFLSRLASVAFIKSGFIPAREEFKAWCQAHGVSIGGKGLPPNESPGKGGPKQIGRRKGGATPARFYWKAKATFFNAANAKHDTKASVVKYAGPALEQGFLEETADTMTEVERRLIQQAHQAGIRTR